MTVHTKEFVHALKCGWLVPGKDGCFTLNICDVPKTEYLHKQSFTFIDLFAGIGGFHQALESLGGQCVLACEKDVQARRVYRAQFSEMFEGLNDAELQSVFPSNIRSITLNENGEERTLEEVRAAVPEHDVLCAGFPCQPFSKSGTQQGIKDQVRGTLFFDLLQIIGARKPKYIFLENVSNLAGPKHRDTWDTIIRALREKNYIVHDQPLVLSPHTVPPQLGGAPQTRTRVFILAIRRDEGFIDRNHILFGKEDLPEFDKSTWDIRDIIVLHETERIEAIFLLILR